MNIIIESYKAGLFQKKNWLPNVVSGIIVGVVALPLAMAFAIASGASPQQGLYTAIVAGFFVSVFGGSRLQIAGPTGAFIVVLSGITTRYGMDGLQIATMMAGVMLVFFGLARLGGVIKFIPDPVIVGFTSGIAVAIFVGQWAYFFGLPAATGLHFHEKLWNLLQEIPQLNWPTTLFGVGALFVVIYSNRLSVLKRVPGPLVALIVGTVLQSIMHFNSVATIGTAYGGIPQGLPSFHLPSITFDKLLELIGPAFTIAMLGSIESLLSAVVADGMAGTRHHSNRELVGQGIANIMSPLFGGFAATGAIARTATNIRNGGNSPLAGIVHVLTLVLVLVLLAPLATNIPLSVLAAILFVVAWNMSEVDHFIALIKRAPRSDVVILLVTFFLTIFVDLVVAVNIGVILAILHFLMQMVASVDVQQQTHAELLQEFPHLIDKPLPNDVLVYAIEGPFFFGAVKLFDNALATIHGDPRVLIIRLRWVPFIDMTGINALEAVIDDFQARGVVVYLCGAIPSVKTKLRNAGILTKLGKKHCLSKVSDALDSIHNLN